MYLYNWIFCKVQAHKKNTPLGSAFPAIIFFCDANYLNHMQHLSNRWYKSDLVSQRSSKKICRSFFVSISESLVQTQLEWQENLFLMLFVCFFPFPLFEVVHKVCAPRKAGQQWLFVTLCNGQLCSAPGHHWHLQQLELCQVMLMIVIYSKCGSKFQNFGSRNIYFFM